MGQFYNQVKHDTNTTRRPEIIRLLRAYGAEGYGVYWMLCEYIREAESCSISIETPEDWEILSEITRKPVPWLKKYLDKSVKDFKTFEIKYKKLTQKDQKDFANILETKSENGRKGGRKSLKTTQVQKNPALSENEIRLNQNSKQKEREERNKEREDFRPNGLSDEERQESKRIIDEARKRIFPNLKGD